MLLRDVATIFIVLAFGGLVIYAVTFNRRCASMEAKVIAMEVALAAHRHQDEAQRIAIGADLSALEMAVFGRKPPPPPTLIRPESWQRNRDQWFNNRLNALERWRLEEQGRRDRER